MSTRRVAVANCQTGTIIAEDVISSSGLTLLGNNSIVTDYIKNRLIELNIPNITVYETKADKPNLELAVRQNYAENVFAIKDILNRLASGDKINYEEILELSDKIYDGIKLSGRLINCLNDIRNVDDYTFSHSINTAFYSMLIAKWMDFKEKDIKRAIQCGLLHDVGKLLVPEELLNKKGILTKSEFNVMQKHTTLGYELLNKMEDIEMVVIQTALLHHERIDGSGYPYSKKAAELGDLTRMVAIADVFDAMTSERIYKKRVPPFAAFKMFKTTGTGLFDPIILEKFLKNIAPFYTCMRVVLNDGRAAQIVHIPPHDIANPVILVDNEYIDLAEPNSPEIVAML